MKWLYFLPLILISLCNACTERSTEYNYILSGDVSMLVEKAQAYEEASDISNALVSYWNALDNANAQDSAQKAKILIQLGDLLFRNGIYEKAVLHHREGYNLLHQAGNYEDLAKLTHKLSMDYLLLNQQDTALYFLELSNNYSGVVITSQQLIDNMLNIKTLHSSVHSDSIRCVYEREKLLNLESHYSQQKEEYQKLRAQNRRLVLFIVAMIILSLLLLVLFTLYWLKKRAEKRFQEQSAWFNAIVAGNKEQLQNYQQELFNSTAQIHELHKQLAVSQDSLKLVNSLKADLAGYIEQEATLRAKEKQLRKRNTQLLSEESIEAVMLINKLKQRPQFNPLPNDKAWKLIIRFMDILFDNYSEFIQNVDGLSDREKEICYLSRLSFTTGQLSIFYGISPGSITKAKFRIKKKMNNDNFLFGDENICA